MAAATGFHCGRCGRPTDSAGVHLDIKTGATVAADNHPQGNQAVAMNWPLVRV